uniref:MFS domain-containing protein n=1 Tax=Rhabditophanes sp. KR3021 TaxID=114890 RepID=A0AC35TX99_9BILA
MPKELILVNLIGLGFLFLFLGFDVKAMIEENMLHSVAHVDPERMNPHAGYYGLALNYGTYAVICLITSYLVDVLGSKRSLVLAGIIFAIHIGLFLFLNSYVYYGISALMGLGISLSWTAQGVYLKEITGKENHLRNSAICWAVNLLSLPIGGLLLLGLERFTVQENLDFMSISTIRLIICALLIAVSLSIPVFWALPNNSGPIKAISFVEMKKAFISNMDILKDSRMQLMIPGFLFIGFETGYWVTVYPTCLQFIKALIIHGGALHITAYYSISVGLGQVTISLLISWMSKRFASTGYMTSILLALPIHLGAFILIVLCVPSESKFHPTYDTAFIETNLTTTMIISFLLGAGDGAWNSIRTAICTSQFSSRTSQSVSMSRLFQSIGCSLAIVLGSVSNLYFDMGLLLVLLILTVICFLFLNNRYLIPKREKNIEDPLNMVDGNNHHPFVASIHPIGIDKN